MKLDQLLIEEPWNAKQIAFHLQQLLAEDDFETKIEHDKRDDVDGYSVWFGPKIAVHVPVDPKFEIAIAKDDVGYVDGSFSSAEEAFDFISRNPVYNDYRTS